MPIHQTLRGAHVPVHIFTDDIDAQALRQLHNIASLPIVHPYVAAMPDVHAGIGATVGSVIPTRGAVIPAAVGVDIGCGMNAVRTTLTASDLPDNLARLRSAIEAEVPVGFEQHDWSRVQGSRHARAVRPLAGRLEHIVERHRGIAKMLRQCERTWICQAGTLGGGNHFIEICLDEEQRVWIMLHSGSRGIGNAIGRYFIAAAQKDMRRHQLQLPDADLAYLSAGSTVFDDYVEAVDWAQDYALLNRSEMMRRVLDVLAKFAPPFQLDGEAINCHHNYIARETHGNADLYVTRKGAISARQGELGIIPGSMGARSFIVRGKGNPQSLCSCSHGAGRSMSRSEAKRRYDRFDLAEQTAGIECRKDGGVVDEIPAAYKNIDAVMAHQSDLVEMVHTLRQVVCIKG
ncbi:tRNA-splicing ligase RtcB [Janthinobacterium sp. OK676]|uniref:RtcB family protein n=1 Tax=Janthinobacterium sp. OK676 TaxID=1855295 RepID=UPI00087E4090|nr:RtcB family protein [Janthinobacterium sp. OK676]SDO03395.1 tRNA-splicing ligase RtcB [Janthinobacterium sp. OK676]